MPTIADKVVEAETSFRNSLEDVITIAEGIKEHCISVQELIGVCKLALDNDGQLRMLMGQMTQPRR